MGGDLLSNEAFAWFVVLTFLGALVWRVIRVAYAVTPRCVTCGHPVEPDQDQCGACETAAIERVKTNTMRAIEKGEAS